MSRNEPSALQIVLDEMRANRNEANISNAAIRADFRMLADKMEQAVDAAMEHADKAHKRLDARENREKGILVGISLGSGSIGAAIMKFLS